MQKEKQYQYQLVNTSDNISSYQTENIAIYPMEMTEDEVKQIKKLTNDSLTFTIPQMNINFCNSFNENFDLVIQYAPIKIYDLSALVVGHRGTTDSTDPDPQLKTIDGNEVYTDAGQTVTVPVDRMYNIGLTIGHDYIFTVTPKEHRFSLQQQSISSLINELNYPLQHIPYQCQRIIKQGDGMDYNTWLTGEIDITSQIYWDVYNGKLRFNYFGLSPNIDQTQNWQELYCSHGDYPDDFLGIWPLPPTSQSDINPVIFSKEKACTFSYAYTSSYIDTYNPQNQHGTGTLDCIYVSQLDSSQDNKIFTINNFYYANQLLGLMQYTPKIFEFMNEYPNNASVTFYPQSMIQGNYHIVLSMIDNQVKYLKNLYCDFYISKIDDQTYIDRRAVLSQEFFLQIWREVYAIIPQLQTNNMIYKPSNTQLYKYIQFTDELNQNLQSIQLSQSQDHNYIIDDNMAAIAWYVNSVSFNNYVSLQNTFPLNYNQFGETFQIEAIKNITVILTDENGVVLPRLNEFKVYIQFQQQSNNTAQTKSTNFNRVISD